MYLERYINKIPRSSGFASDEEFFANLYPAASDMSSRYGGIPLYTHNGKTYLEGGPECRHMLLFGSTGCGKTRRLLMTSILYMLCAREKRSMIVFDVKMELSKMTMPMAKKKGFNTLMLNFRNPGKSKDAWNPFEYANSLYAEGKKVAAWQEIDALSALIFNDGENTKIDPFWRNSSRMLFKGLVDYIWRKKMKVTVRELVKQCNRIEVNTYSSEILKECGEFGKDTLAYQGLSSVIDASQGTAGNILASYKSYMACLVGREEIQDMLSREDGMQFDVLGKKPSVLYVCLPDDDESNGVLQSILLRQMIQKLNLCAIENGGCLPTRVELLIDELCNMPKIPALAQQLTISRSRGMRFLLVCQSYEQLVSRYDSDAGTVATNCATWVMMYVAKDRSIIDKACRLAGTNDFGEDLIDPSSLALMPMGQALVFSEHKRPYMTLLDDVSDVIAHAVQSGRNETPAAA